MLLLTKSHLLAMTEFFVNKFFFVILSVSEISLFVFLDFLQNLCFEMLCLRSFRQVDFYQTKTKEQKMPIKPKSFIAKCPKCGKVKFVSPKSDALSPLEMCPMCEKCKVAMTRIKTNTITDFIKGLFG